MDDTKAYGNTSLGDIIKEAHERSRDQKKTIDGLVEQLSDMMDEPSDALELVPLLKDYLKIEVDNNELLVKIARVVQRASQGSGDGNGEEDVDESGLSSSHKKELRKIAEELGEGGKADNLVKDAEDIIKNGQQN